MTIRNKIPIKPIISGILVITACLWLAWIVYQNQAELLELYRDMTVRNMLWLVAATAFVMLAISLLVPLFHILVYQNCHLDLPIRFLAKLFFSGQIVSYLPSRFLGTAYMVNETQKLIPAITMVRINIELVALIMLYNGFVSVAILAYYVNSAGSAAAVFIVGTVIFSLYLRLNLLDKILALAARLAPPNFREKLQAARSKVDFDYPLICKVIGLLLLYWIFYLLAWLCLQNTFPILAGENVIVLGATYTLSWIIGFITLITPGGLGIREVSFVALNTQFLSRFHSSFLAIFLRIWLILIDFTLFVISRAILYFYPVTGKADA